MARQFVSPDVVDWGDLAAFDGLSKLTVSCWLRITESAETSSVSIVNDFNGVEQDGWAVQFNYVADRLTWTQRNAADGFRYSYTLGFTYNTWHHCVFVYDGALAGAERAKIYVDGSPAAMVHNANGGSQYPPATLSSNTGALRFQNSHDDNTIALAEVALWAGVALSATQAEDLYDAGGIATAIGEDPDLYAHLVDAIEDEMELGTPSVTGTTAVDHPIIHGEAALAQGANAIAASGEASAEAVSGSATLAQVANVLEGFGTLAGVLEQLGRKFGRRFGRRFPGGWRIGGGVEPVPPPPEPPGEELGKIVAAHFMHRIGVNQANNRPLSDYKLTLTQMEEAGINCCVCYWDDWNAHPNEYINVLQSARELRAEGTPAALFAWGFLGCQNPALTQAIYDNRNDSGLFRDSEGRLIISGFYNAWKRGAGNCGYDYLTDLENRGIEFAYWPDYWSGEGSSYISLVDAALAGAHGGWFPFYPFDGSNSSSYPGIGGAADVTAWLAFYNTQKALADAAGIGLMPGVIPAYHGNLDHSTQPHGPRFEGNGFTGLKAQCEWCIDNDVEGLQIVTFNDPVEDSGLQSFGGTYPFNKNSWTPIILIDRSGYRHFLRRYMVKFRTGAFPAVTQDEVIWCCKGHPRAAVSYGGLSSAVKDTLDTYLPAGAYPHGGSPPDPRGWAAAKCQRVDAHDIHTDFVEVCVRLTSAATVTLTVGNTTSGAVYCDTGESIIRVDGATDDGNGKKRFSSGQLGTPHVLITRNSGATLVYEGDAPAPITEYIVPFNYRTLCVRALPTA